VHPRLRRRASLPSQTMTATAATRVLNTDTPPLVELAVELGSGIRCWNRRARREARRHRESLSRGMSSVGDATRAEGKLGAVISSVDHYLQARERLIVELHAERGRSPRAIADLARMNHQAIANVIERATGERP
jgi:hypothetical protein